MKVAIISFTNKGTLLREKINAYLNNQGDEIVSSIDGRDKEIPLKEWTKSGFEKCDFLIFIGACAIAVRSIAPFLKSKKEDLGVLVIDEQGKYIIPVLSGHIGGANEFALNLAGEFNSVPIITTATDINNKFAVDVFATKNNLYISDMKVAKDISAAVLDNKTIGLRSELDISGNIPNEIEVGAETDLGIYIGIKEEKPFKETLNLIPKIVTLGIGCRKDTPKKNIEAAVLETLKENNISLISVKNLASIDLKENEKGILDFSSEYNIDFVTFSSDELKNVEGEFSESEFVDKITGVSCVCERAAVKGSDSGEILVKKTIKYSVTVAVARKNRSVNFE